MAEHGNGDGQKWRVLQTVIFIAGAATALFVAGMNYGTVKDATVKVETQQRQFTDYVQQADQMYVRKDGRDLEAIRGDLKALNEKVDRLLRRTDP